jgi:hypothetical protein
MTSNIIKLVVRNISRKRFIALFIIGCICVSSFIFVHSEEYTIVSISDKTVGINETFTLDIMCYPAQYIKAWELEVSYPMDKLQLISVTDGTIFSGYQVFFSNGTINTSSGKLEKLYSVILGSGNVSGSGSLVSITFKSLKAGIAPITLEKVGVCNETAYLPVDIVDGTIYIDNSSPLIMSVSACASNPIDTDIGWVNISSVVSDDTMILSSLLYLKTPSNSINIPFSSFYYNSSTMFQQIGNYSYYILVSDTVGNTNTSKTYNLSISPNYEIVVDGAINMMDFLQLSSQYGRSGVNGWIREDVDNNGNVCIQDLILSAMKYNETWWQ